MQYAECPTKSSRSSNLQSSAFVSFLLLTALVVGVGLGQATGQDVAVPVMCQAQCPDGSWAQVHCSGSDGEYAAACHVSSGGNTGSSGSAGNLSGVAAPLTGAALRREMNQQLRQQVANAAMQGAINGFLSSMAKNNAASQQQQIAFQQEMQRRQQEAEEQRRLAEQQRIAAMFARLNSELKLEGLPFTLSLKGMNSTGPDGLQLKGMSSSGPGDLRLKIGDAGPTSYGLKGLPGVYVGGPAGGDGSSSDSLAGANAAGANGAANADAAGAAGNPNLASGPGSGTTGPGIPGLPGIYLDSVQPSQAPQLAQAAQNLPGPEKAVAEDTALDAAHGNPALTAPSENPQVQNFQQANQDYQQALKADSSARQELEMAQTHVATDQGALDTARAQLSAITPSVQQQAAFNQMIAAAHSDEEASVLARQNFDSTEIHLSTTRDQAALALAQTSTPVLSPNATPTLTASTVSSRPNPAPLALPAHALVLPAATPRAAPMQPSPATKAPASLDTCLATAGRSPVTDANRPTPEQLRAQLDHAKEALARLLETHMRENEEREDWAKDMKKSGVDTGFRVFDLTGKMVLGHYADNAKQEADWAQLYSNEQRYKEAKDAQEGFESAAKTLEQAAKARDAVLEAMEHDKGKEDDLLRGVQVTKELLNTFLSQDKVQKTLERWAVYGLKAGEAVPFVDRTVTIGGAVIDTGYDLTVEYLGFAQLQKADQNSELFYRGAAPLQKQIRATVDQLKCYQ